MAFMSSGLPAGKAHRRQGATATLGQADLMRRTASGPGGRRYHSFCVTFRVFVVMSDILRVSAANGLRVDALSNVGGVHGVWSQSSIFVLLVEDQVAVHLQET